MVIFHPRTRNLGLIYRSDFRGQYSIKIARLCEYIFLNNAMAGCMIGLTCKRAPRASIVEWYYDQYIDYCLVGDFMKIPRAKYDPIICGNSLKLASAIQLYSCITIKQTVLKVVGQFIHLLKYNLLRKLYLTRLLLQQ